jgi:hypothetical protein
MLSRGRVRRGVRHGAADARRCTTNAMLARYGSVVYGIGDGRGVPDMEDRRMDKQTKAENDFCRRVE